MLKQFIRNKFNAVQTVVDGITFDSKREAKRYAELLFLEKHGKIKDLKIHRRFPLFVNNVLIGHYEADFDYIENGKHIIEDTKGYQTDMFKWKWKHCKAQYTDKEWKIVK